MSLDEWVPICNVRLASRRDSWCTVESYSDRLFVSPEVIGKFDLRTHELRIIKFNTAKVFRLIFALIVASLHFRSK